MDEQRFIRLIDEIRLEPTYIKEAASGELTRMGPAAVPALLERLQSNAEENWVKAYIVDVLGNIGDRRAIEPLFELLPIEDIDLVSSVPYALVQIGDLDINQLLKALEDKRWRVRASVAMILGEIGGENMISPLHQMLVDENPTVIWHSISALGKIGDHRSVHPIIKMLQHSGSSVRGNAADALGKIGDASAANVLINALSDDNVSVSESAARALGLLGVAEAVDPLLEMMHDSDLWVRCASIVALGQIGDARAIPVLLDALDDEIPAQYRAIDALGKIGDKRVLPKLASLSTESEPGLPPRIEDAIKKIESRQGQK